MRFQPVFIYTLLFLTLASRGWAETVVNKLEVKPFDGVTEYAAKHGIATEGIEFVPEASSSRPGDEVVYLLGLQQSSGLQQWLVRLISASPDTKKGEAKSLDADTMFTSTGLELHYPNSPAVLNIEFIGPFVADTPGDATVETRRGRAIVSAESLQQGLFRYCESSVDINARLKQAGIKNPIYYGGSSRPKPGVIEAGRKAADAFGLTAGEERLAFSVYFALRSFYNAASEIPACREVLEKVLQKPSLWAIASNLGLGANFEYGWQHVSKMPDGSMPVTTPVYALPLRLSISNQPALKVSLAVTDTRPPLRNCAGIVSLVAEHPTDTSKRVFLHLLSAHPTRSETISAKK